MDKKDFSFSMAARLKQLREEHGLSHQKLSDTLDEMLGISISKDSLMKYEVATEHHSTPFKNLGMRAEYLTALAAFYGVSADYILGLTDIKSASADVQTVISYTGLSEENATTLCRMKNRSSLPLMNSDSAINASAPYIDFLNDLLEALWSNKESLIGDYMIMRYYADNAKPHNPNCYDEKREQELLEHGQTTIPVRSLIEYKSTTIAKAIEQFLLDKYANKKGDGL